MLTSYSVSAQSSFNRNAILPEGASDRLSVSCTQENPSSSAGMEQWTEKKSVASENFRSRNRIQRGMMAGPVASSPLVSICFNLRQKVTRFHLHVVLLCDRHNQWWRWPTLFSPSQQDGSKKRVTRKPAGSSRHTVKAGEIKEDNTWLSSMTPSASADRVPPEMGIVAPPAYWERVEDLPSDTHPPSRTSGRLKKVHCDKPQPDV